MVHSDTFDLHIHRRPNKTGDSLDLRFFADMNAGWGFGSTTSPVLLRPPIVPFQKKTDAPSNFWHYGY